jgi:peptide/nickel transport system substrate-binding protein
MTKDNNVSRRTFGTGLLATSVMTQFSLAGASDTPKRGGTLVATWGGAEPQSCYVPTGGGTSPTFSSSKLLERLANKRQDGNVVGVLVENWKAADDFKSYTIRIRRGVKWHDGKDFTVDDVVYGIETIWKKYAAPLNLTEMLGVETIDAGTLIGRFARPTPESMFVSTLIGAASYIVREHIYDGSDPSANPANNSPVGTGPWKFNAWVRGSHFEFVKNENYWRDEMPYLDRIVIRYLRDPAARAAAMEAGEIQLGNPVGAPDLKRLAATGQFDITTKGYEEVAWNTTLECNMRDPVFADKSVRQALFHAIDRGFIAKAIFYGFARAGTGPIDSSNKEFASRGINKLEFNPQKAGELLDADGFRKDATGKRFALNLIAAAWFAENPKIGAYIKQALEDIGIQINLPSPDRPTSLKRIYTDYDYDLAISNSASASEPVPSVAAYITTDGTAKGVAFRNAKGVSNPDLDALVDRIKIETSVETRKALINDLQKILTNEAVYLPLVEISSVTVANKIVRNHSLDTNFVADSWADLWIGAGP